MEENNGMNSNSLKAKAQLFADRSAGLPLVSYLTSLQDKICDSLTLSGKGKPEIEAADTLRLSKVVGIAVCPSPFCSSYMICTVGIWP